MTTRIACCVVAASMSLFVIGCGSREEGAATKLKDADPQVRRTAIRALASTDGASKDSLPQLLAILDDEDKSVRVTAALAIQRLEPQNSKSQAILTEALRDGQGPVLVEVGRLGTSASWAVPMLVSLLADSRAPIRALSAQAIGEIGATDDRVMSSLRRGLRDNNLAVRKACEKALNKLTNSPAALPP